VNFVDATLAASGRRSPALGLHALRLLLLAELLVAAAVVLGLWTLRRQTVDAELRHLASLAGAMAAQADATLDAANAVLQASRDELAQGRWAPGSAAAEGLLRARIAGLPRFRALVLADERGAPLASSQPRLPPPAPPELLAAVRSATPGSLSVSLPYPAPARPAAAAAAAAAVSQAAASVAGAAAAAGAAAIAVATDWRDAAGRFQGVVMLVADPEFLDRDFPKLAPSPDTRMALYRSDGALIADGPGDNSRTAEPDAVARGVWNWPETGAARPMPLDDGSVRLVAARPLAHQQMMLVVSRGQAETLAGWTDQARLVGAFAASALAATLLLGLRNARARAERERLQEQLARARRLEALGTLAGGVAHDFNNVLAAVVGYGELARAQVAEGSAAARQLDQVLQAGQRGRSLVDRILAFSRGAPRPHAPLRLQPLVDEVLQMLQASLPPAITLQRRLQAPQAVVQAEAAAVFEAVMNLCVNGLQAMQQPPRPAGGCLTVSLALHPVAAGRRLFEGRLQPGLYARLGVQDEGDGIAAEALPRLFEPFFTTRRGDAAGHQGTGLGLAVVHGVVSELGGAIDVHSRPGEGAYFELYLPCSDGDAMPAAPPPANDDTDADAALPLGRGEAVLVVDDEPALVRLAEEMLAGLGYEPFGTASSAEALQRLRAEPDRFELLLTDERMPGLSGTALAAAAHALRPQLPVVLASGWGGPRFEQRAAAAGVAVRIAKPLTRAALAQALARALGRAA